MGAFAHLASQFMVGGVTNLMINPSGAGAVPGYAY